MRYFNNLLGVLSLLSSSLADSLQKTCVDCLMPRSNQYDFLIVGAGLTGSVLAERLASQLDRRVLVIDRRGHIAGNAHDRLDDHGVMIHQYGPHLFHTNSVQVWNYLSGFTEWHPYEHRVLAEIDGECVPVPFNLTCLHTLFPPAQATRLEQLLVYRYGMENKVSILKLRDDTRRANDLSKQDAEDLRWLADFIYENLFYGYTTKQWGLTPEELGPSITGRVPVHISWDDRYFQDTYQALPKNGYTAMVRSLLSHGNIDVETNVSFLETQSAISFDHLIYTGPIDEYFDHTHGELPYRSLRFEFEHIEKPYYQSTTQVNFPNTHQYTRITEFKHATGQRTPGTTIAREYPQAHVHGENEPYYPIPLDCNYRLYEKYAAEVDKAGMHVTFAGRLADYKYYNMDQAVGRALAVFRKRFVT